MSLDYHVFSLVPNIVAIEHLAATMASAGWTIRVIRNWFGDDRMELVTRGPLADGDVTCGWRGEWPQSGQFDRCVAANDRKSLRPLIDEQQLPTTDWSISQPFDFATDCEYDSLESLADAAGEAIAEHIAKCQCQYHNTGSFDPEFGAALLGAIAMLTDGVVEDPQLGMFFEAPTTSEALAAYIENWDV